MGPVPRARSWSSARAGPLLSGLRSPFSAFIHPWAAAGGRADSQTRFYHRHRLQPPAFGARSARRRGDQPFGIPREQQRPGPSHRIRESEGLAVCSSGQSDAESQPLRERAALPAAPPPRASPGFPAQRPGTALQLPEGFATTGERQGGGPLSEQPSNPGGTWRPALPEVPGSGAPSLARASVLVARLAAAKMAAEHPEPPKGELQLPPPPPPGHYGAWAVQELQAKLAEIGAPIQGKESWRPRARRAGLRGSGAWLPRRSGAGRRAAGA